MNLRPILVAAVLAVGTVQAQIPQPANVPPGFSANVADTWANVPPGPAAQWQDMKPADTYGYADITKGGTTTASCEHFAREGHENLFDDTPAKWCAKEAKIWAQYAMPESGKALVPIAYTVTSANDFPDRDPKSWRLLGSQDGETWTEIDVQQDQSFLSRHFKKLYKIAQPAAFPIYRFEVTENWGNIGTQIEEVELLVPAQPDPELTAADIAALRELAAQPEGYQPLIAPDFANAILKEGAWDYTDGVLTAKGGSDIWTKDLYGDFILELDFQCAADTNSGVFVRCASIQDWLNTAIEVQIRQPKEGNARHDCGGIFDVKAPEALAVRPVGEWNHYLIIAKANRLLVWLNDTLVTDIDLNLWTTPGKNPDGSPNKFRYAYRALAREGHLGLQYHGQPITFRNLRVKPIAKAE